MTAYSGADGISFDPHANSTWFADQSPNLVTQLNDITYTTSTYSVGGGPSGIAFDSHTNTLWVANSYDNTVTQINDTTYATSTYSVGSDPYIADAVAFDSHTNTIWGFSNQEQGEDPREFHQPWRWR